MWAHCGTACNLLAHHTPRTHARTHPVWRCTGELKQKVARTSSMLTASHTVESELVGELSVRCVALHLRFHYRLSFLPLHFPRASCIRVAVINDRFAQASDWWLNWKQTNSITRRKQRHANAASAIAIRCTVSCPSDDRHREKERYYSR